MRTRVVAISIFLTAHAFAQQRIQLSIEEAVRVGLENSRQLHSSEMRRESSEAKAGEIGASRFPSPFLSSHYTLPVALR